VAPYEPLLAAGSTLNMKIQAFEQRLTGQLRQLRRCCSKNRSAPSRRSRKQRRTISCALATVSKM
jgi:hypothetical protein